MFDIITVSNERVMIHVEMAEWLTKALRSSALNVGA